MIIKYSAVVVSFSNIIFSIIFIYIYIWIYIFYLFNFIFLTNWMLRKRIQNQVDDAWFERTNKREIFTYSCITAHLINRFRRVRWCCNNKITAYMSNYRSRDFFLLDDIIRYISNVSCPLWFSFTSKSRWL